MLALVVAMLVVTALLGVIVAGLLRSHADIIRALHELGAGVGYPGEAQPVELRRGPHRFGPALPEERSSTSVHDVAGISPGGDAVVVSTAAAGLTLLAFLSSGCSSCAGFWAALGQPAQLALLPARARVVVVTKGPEWESPQAIAAQAPPGLPVIMSTAAWGDYEVPGSPFFVLVDGAAGARAGEGAAAAWEQVADLVRRAEVDAGGRPSRPTAGNGADREKANDAELLAAGIGPGHPSLYPRTLGGGSSPR